MISRLKNDSAEAVAGQIQKISAENEDKSSNLHEKWKNDCTKEILKEIEIKFRDSAREKFFHLFEKDMRKNITARIEMELKLRLEDQICQEINKDFETSHEYFRKKLENDQYNKILEIEQEYENNLSASISQAVEKKL